MALWQGIGLYVLMDYQYKPLLIHDFCVGLRPPGRARGPCTVWYGKKYISKNIQGKAWERR